MGNQDLNGVFFLNPANREFAEGTGRYTFYDSSRSAAVFRLLGKIGLAAGIVATLWAAAAYLRQEHAKADLIASVKTVAATVSGCERPGAFQNVRFHYQVDGRPFDVNAYLRQTVFVGGGGLIAACQAGTVKLNILSGAPARWAIAPLSPITRHEMNQEIEMAYLVSGPAVLAISGLFFAAAFAQGRRQARCEKLRDFGIVLGAKLVKMTEDQGEGSTGNVVVRYTFRNPAGMEIAGTGSGLQRGMKKKDFPAPGTKMLVVYVDDQVHEPL